ncbi:hypothetical protein CONPUDRAFT_144771 [Coniophora puteana RWD-64-598 SS2]|uniref:Uncharacterized protein n=1 Tax=Coniophora puteana (strain RWD-64-598) TaxID=741705 RepID=A0A5M3MJW3_CONPW|nr:uncharacterized protein CONPUDRAFT_144771 [Coniophora puteana RWD-64-598 SS2]EIW79502.1 hypothetical protein CONPUDRAFT_144771 [Coniophora puteana RWD-64-598 SS2]
MSGTEVDVSPSRLICSGCSEWIILGERSTHEDRFKPWFQHRSQCELAQNMELSLLLRKQKRTWTDAHQRLALLLRKQKRTLTKAHQRFVLLKADEYVAEAHPQKALCRACNSWVALGSKGQYCLRHWLLHRRKCSKILESERLAEKPQEIVQPKTKGEEQRISFLQAEYTDEIQPHKVRCRGCGKWIALRSEQRARYNSYNWIMHRGRCKGIQVEEAERREVELLLTYADSACHS